MHLLISNMTNKFLRSYMFSFEKEIFWKINVHETVLIIRSRKTMSAKIDVLKVFFFFFFCSIFSFKGWRPYPNYHAKRQFDVKLYTHLPTLVNVERGNPQNYDAFKKHIQVFTIPLSTLIQLI